MTTYDYGRARLSRPKGTVFVYEKIFAPPLCPHNHPLYVSGSCSDFSEKSIDFPREKLDFLSFSVKITSSRANFDGEHGKARH
jgi:hypothetical protein